MAVLQRASASASASSSAKGEGNGIAVQRGNPSAATENAGDQFLNEPGGGNDETGGNDDELSLMNLMPAVAVSTLVSVASYYSCESVEMAEDILVCTVRTFLQLSLLAALLSPLFRFVENQTRLSLASSSSSSGSNKYSKHPGADVWRRTSAPLLVLAYVFCFMLPLAAYEASGRTKLTLRPTTPPNKNVVLPIVASSLFLAVSTMGAVAIFAIIRPTPWYSPRHVIPLCGMIFNNALSGVSLGLDALFAELRTKRETIELMISFGADAWTATRPSFGSVLATAMRPQINSMSVIGLVAIPGMMTGQVLSGASPTRAARYQIVIMCLILGGLFIAVSSTTQLVIWQAFDGRGALQNDMIVDNDSLRVSQVVSSMVSISKRFQGDLGISEGSMGSQQNMEGTASSRLIVELSTTAKPRDDGSPPHLRVNLHGSFANEMRVMTANFEIPTSGDIAILKGVSGVGKSTLLKTIAELHSGFFPSMVGPATVSLSGRERNDFHPSEWRRSVLYVPQEGSSSLQGTPGDFLAFVASLQGPTLEWLTTQTTTYMGAWGINKPESTLDQPWSKLSGGESQRVLIAISLATMPKVLLLDEPTSALDLETKLKVEESLKQSAKNGCAMIVVSHDEDQMNRLGTMMMSLDVVS